MSVVLVEFADARLVGSVLALSVSGGQYYIDPLQAVTVDSSLAFTGFNATAQAIRLSVVDGGRFSARIFLPIAASGDPTIEADNFVGDAVVIWQTANDRPSLPLTPGTPVRLTGFAR